MIWRCPVAAFGGLALILLHAGCGSGDPSAGTVRSGASRHGAGPAVPVRKEPAAVAQIAEARALPLSRPSSARAAAAEPQRQPPETVAAAPEPVYRPPDTRPRHDDARALELGIRRYESRRLLLYSDIDPETAQSLPPLMDQAFEALEEYFGPLPPARDGSDFQITGYVMADRERFRAAGMLPQEAMDLLVHGLHRDSEFWMNEQEYDYYRRHLLVHEGTHCFMTALPGPRPPVWYMEGMAEYFAAHQVEPDGHVSFGVMPADPRNFVGFGRVEMIRDEIAQGRCRSVNGVLALSVNDFLASRKEPYAWSWAFCKFLDSHPRYQERFRMLSRHLVDPDFSGVAERLFAPDAGVMAVEWELFVRNLEYGFDIPRSAIEFRKGEPLPPGAQIETAVQADRGWQCSGIWVEAGQTYVVSANGEVILAHEPRPWLSEPQGVSIRYSQGKPLGRLLAGIQSEEPPGPDGEGALWHVIDVGREMTLIPAVSGTLYLRVNDDWSRLADNQGEFRVAISRP